MLPTCPIHKETRLEKKTTGNGWVFIKCSVKECMLFCSEADLTSYISSVKSQLHEQFRKIRLTCFCNSTPTLKQRNKSEVDSGRLCITCGQKVKCNFFQWGDIPLTRENAEWIMACHGRHPSRDTDGYPQEGCDIPRALVVIESTNEISVKACQYDRHDTDDTNGNPQEGYDISRAPPAQACRRGSAVVMESTKEIVKACQYDHHPKRDTNGNPLEGDDIPRASPIQACRRGSAVVMESTKEIVKAFQYNCHPNRDANGYPLKGYDIPGPIMRTNEIVAVLN